MLRWVVWALFPWLLACAASPAPPASPGAPSRRALVHAARRAPRPAPPLRLAPGAEPTAAVAPVAAPVERRRCALRAGAAAHGFYRDDVWEKGQVVLTFDDGPHPGKTPKVLDLLAKHEMPATFFLVGVAIRQKTYRLVQRMVAEGHTLGSHSYNHDVGMALRNHGERSIEYISGQHVTTQILIEIALLAESDEDFERLYRRVFERPSGGYLPSGKLRTEYPIWAERHAEILAERGFEAGERPYPVVYSRPPGGGPYLGAGAAERRLYDSALARVGMLNVMWHGESGDTNPDKKHDFGFLTENLRHFSRKGGILLIHDYIRTDALATALARMAGDPSVEVVPLARAVEDKFRCAPAEVLATLSAASQRGPVAFTR